MKSSQIRSCDSTCGLSQSVFRSFMRKRTGHCFIFFMLLSLFFSNPLYAEKKSFSKDTIPPIEYGYPDQSIFVATTDSSGHPDSPMNNLANALMQKTSIPWRAQPYPARRLFRNLKNGTTNFSILVRASSLKDCCLFSKKPVYSTTLDVFRIGDRPPIESKYDLIGNSVITIRGYSYAGLLKFISNPANNITNEVTGTHKSAFSMLKIGRANYLLDYQSAASFILKENPIDNIRSNKIGRLDIYLILSKSYPNAQKLMDRFEEIVETLNVSELLGVNP